MRAAFLCTLAFVTFGISAQASNEPKLTEEVAAGMRAMHGIRDLSADADSEHFAFRDDGNFLISRQTFSTQKEAVAFCASKPGYRLNGGTLPGVLTMMGLPFMNLQKQMIVSDEVLNGRSGVVAWTSFDLSKIPAGFEPANENEREVFAMLKEGDFVMAQTNGDGGSGDGFMRASRINMALKALGKAPLALSAICVDEKLTVMDR